MKKFASLLLAVIMVASIIPFAVIPAAAEEEAQPTFYEFLDVGAGAYINTGIIPTNATRVVMDMEQNKAPETALFGVAKGWGGYALYSFDNGQLVYFYGDGGTFEAGTMTTGRHTVETDKNAVKIDGVQTYADTAQSISVDGHTMYLFAVNNIIGSKASAWAGDGQFIRFYSCKIYEGDDLVRDFVPATKVNAEGVLETGVYDNKEGKFYAKQGNGNMEAYVHAYQYLEQGSELPISWEGVAIDFDGTITVSHDTTIIAPSCTSAIYICPGRNVTIEIQEGVTLNAWGGDASGEYGAGAGIEVPENATLTITGAGTVNVKGGNAAVGGNGENGVNAKDNSVFRIHASSYGKYYYLCSGNGGKGGNGGGGAGAGIGGRGGNGGLGGDGGAGIAARAIESESYQSGIAGKNGKNGTAGHGGGKITVSDTLKGKIQGGTSLATPSQGGGSGGKDIVYYIDGGIFYYCSYGGGGGGAGGNGYAAAGIGNGGYGGAGGGGSGFLTYWDDLYNSEITQGTGHAGLGGLGSVAGKNGKDNGADVNAEDLVAGAGGKGGDAGKAVVKGDNLIYLDEATQKADLIPSAEINAGAYFDTFYKPIVNTRVVFDAAINNKATALFGLWYNDKDGECCCHVNAGGDSEYGPSGYGSGFGCNAVRWAENAPVLPGRHTIELSASGFRYDGVMKDPDKNTYFPASDQTIYLFAINVNGETQTFAEQHIRFYSCQIYEGYNLVRDFVPVKIGDEIGLYEKQTGMTYENLGDGKITANQEITPESGLPGGMIDQGVLIDFDGKITVSKDTTVTALPAQSGIIIGSGRNVTIEIMEGVTLTVRGGNAVGTAGAGAGIEVQQNATLTIIGTGTLDAKGGDAAAGENGSNGGNASGVIWFYYALPYSGGGRGGNGGGGAGAGIGGKGGDGGKGGKGGAGVSSTRLATPVCISGNAGENGEDGTPGVSCGKVTISDTVKATVKGGMASADQPQGGDCGGKSCMQHNAYTADKGDDQAWYCSYGGGGGGAGGNGYAAENVGNGGAGAGGGGGGGSGFVTWWNRYRGTTANETQGTGHGGIGGVGAIGSINGKDNGAEVHGDGLTAGAGGKGGNNGNPATSIGITTVEQLTELAQAVANGTDYAGVYFWLMCDLTYNGQIGAAGHPFKGIFDGNGYTLTVNISNSGTGTGLFAETDGATIKNLALVGSVSGTNCVGGIVGHAYGNTHIENCYVTASVTGTAENVGGIAGMMYESTITNCRVDGTVKSTGSGVSSTGGIVGWLHGSCHVVNCVKTGETVGYNSVGGIAGTASEGDSVIANCASIGTIKANNNAGGIIGTIEDNVRTFRIYSCYVNCDDMWKTVRHARGFICGNNQNASIYEKVENSDIYTVRVEQDYYHYVKRERVYEGNNFLPSTAVKADNISEVLSNLNAYAGEHGNLIPGAALTKWTQVGGDLLPETCTGFAGIYDSQNGIHTGSILSNGSLTIIVGIAAAVVFGLGGFFLGTKKKKKTALASGAEKENEK